MRTSRQIVVTLVLVAILSAAALVMTRYRYILETDGQRIRIDRWTGNEAVCDAGQACIDVARTCGDCGAPSSPTQR